MDSIVVHAASVDTGSVDVCGTSFEFACEKSHAAFQRTRRTRTNMSYIRAYETFDGASVVRFSAIASVEAALFKV